MSRESKSRYRYNHKTMMYEKHIAPWHVRYGKVVLSGIAVLALMTLYGWIYLDVLNLDSPKMAILKSRNSEWASRIAILNHSLNQSEKVLEELEERDNNVYRSIFGMKTITGEARSYAPDFMEDGYDPAVASRSSRLLSTGQRIADLSKRSVIQSKSLGEVSEVSKNAGNMISCIPAVPPILPDRRQVYLSSSYGYRSDPVYGRTAFHRGQDFAVHRGYPVYAPGDGEVVCVRYQFRGYGNEIIIDHGFGYRTLYAHLSSIDVQEGMKVRRGDKIGEVGSTGKSTGPHLHYEVEYKGKNINPMPFVDMNMEVDEYKAMVRKRAEENEAGRQLSTSDLMERINRQR